MALLSRVYYNAVFGALGGLIGWMLFGVLADRNSPGDSQTILGGLLIGGFIGYFIVGAEAIRDRSLVRFCRLASYGVVLGSLGGAVGMWIGEQVHYKITQSLLDATMLRRIGEIVSRGLGWMLLGVAVGLSEGVASRSLGKLSYGSMGGAIGGLAGGIIYGIIKVVSDSSGPLHVWGGAIGLVILGACIGALSALVQGVFLPASVRVLRGWQEGREYALSKKDNFLGRDEAADIALFRDMRVEKRHAIIQRDGNRFMFVNNKAPLDQTLINDQPVADLLQLKDGDRIQLGNVMLRFQAREAGSRQKTTV